MDVIPLIQSLEVERDQYVKDFDSNRFSFVREIVERFVDQNNQFIQKLESLKRGSNVLTSFCCHPKAANLHLVSYSKKWYSNLPVVL